MVPKPSPVNIQGLQTFRYEERLPEQALLQKLAREISGLVAARQLHQSGFFQEQGVIQRTLDELNEDIAFLAFGLCQEDRLPDLHLRYLEAFWQEEFSEDESGVFSVGRVYPPRRKIRNYIFSFSSTELETAKRHSDTISKMHSGFVHGASPHIMEMCWGENALFHLDGMSGSALEPAYRKNLDNNLYRATISVGFAAKAFGDAKLFGEVADIMTELERLDGRGV